MKVPFRTIQDPKLGDIAYDNASTDVAKAAVALIRPKDRVLEIGGGDAPLCAAIADATDVWRILSCGMHRSAAERLLTSHGHDSRVTIRTQTLTLGAQTPGTLNFNEVVETFRPNVLIVHVGPDEAELLQSADLRGFVRSLFDFSRPECRIADMFTAKSQLKKLGFRKQPAQSSRHLWVCTQPATDHFDPANRPSHHGGWSEQIEVHKNAVVQPTVGRSLSAQRGVQTAAGGDIPISGHWRHGRRMTLPFAPPQVGKTLPGRHLWGGIFYRMFSHFVAESLSRLWALDADDGPIDSVVFVKIGENQDSDLAGYHRDLFDLMGVRCPVQVVDTPTAFEELVVPGQGFGLGSIVEGTARFKAYLARNFATDVAPEGPDKLYISRSKLGLGKGSLLGEAVIEEHLRAEGYEIFHPEQHDIRTQVARYKAAQQVVACDGSALHLLALCHKPCQRLAMICRRKSVETRQIARNIHGFTGVPPQVIHCLDGEWQRDTGSKRKGLVMGQPNLAVLHMHLLEGGFVTSTAPWAPLEHDQLVADLGAGWAPV